MGIKMIIINRDKHNKQLWQVGGVDAVAATVCTWPLRHVGGDDDDEHDPLKESKYVVLQTEQRLAP
jgi:hypothetical protein